MIYSIVCMSYNSNRYISCFLFSFFFFFLFLLCIFDFLAGVGKKSCRTLLRLTGPGGALTLYQSLLFETSLMNKDLSHVRYTRTPELPQ